MSVPAISAPSATFLAGLHKTLGYNVEEEAGNIMVSFEPWGLEQTNPFDVPCLRLEFRQVGHEVVLERFTVSEEGEEREVDLGAARDALQAWMDWMAD